MNWGEVFILMIILVIIKLVATITAWKVSKYGVFSGPHFPVFSPSTGKYVFGLFSRNVFLGNYSVFMVGVMFLWKIMVRLEILGKGWRMSFMKKKILYEKDGFWD